ncbi:MAG: DUF2382 domain-containing protein [Cyanobacteriota bacterium]|nr:DUF2382 domain-containing protein [Cyanobacteriota bacterium]
MSEEKNERDLDLLQKKLDEEKEKQIQLLEEKVVVNRIRKKVGEVVVRKEVETKMVDVKIPLRQEKLIIEQVGSDGIEKLAEVDLVQEKIAGVEENSYISYDAEYIVAGEFISPSVARDVLAAIDSGCAKVRLEIVVENPELQQIYQQIFDTCTNN